VKRYPAPGGYSTRFDVRLSISSGPGKAGVDRTARTFSINSGRLVTASPDAMTIIWHIVMGVK